MTVDQSVVVSPVETGEELEAVKELFRAYVDWLGIDLAFQDFDTEMKTMPGKYTPPSGALFLARNLHGKIVGCVGLRPLEPAGTCEMKRLYVLPEGRGYGVGAALIDRVLKAAVLAGYRSMVLDTLPTMAGAIKLYKAAGFEETDAYYDNPLGNALFFRKVLSTTG